VGSGSAARTRVLSERTAKRSKNSSWSWAPAKRTATAVR